MARMDAHTSTRDDVALDAVDIVSQHFNRYVAHLYRLISTPTVTSSTPDVQVGINLCKEHFEKYLTSLSWTIRVDAKGNLQCSPPPEKLDIGRPILWLCAHIDTVAANRDEWHEQMDPFVCHETDLYLTGRGANDCKAGIAFMLWYAELLAARLVPQFNGGFLVTCHEEAGSPVPRTAPQYAMDFESGKLCVSTLPHATFLVCLENTVSLGKEISSSGECELPEIGVYTRESHSFVVKVLGTIEQLRLTMQAIGDPDWKTVAIWPVNAERQRVEVEDVPGGAAKLNLKKYWQDGGHSCTVRNKDNYIHNLLMGINVDCCLEEDAVDQSVAADFLAWSGQESETSKVSSLVMVGKAPPGVPQMLHAMVLNYRGLAPVKSVMDHVEKMIVHASSVTWLSDKSEGTGSEQTAFFTGSVIEKEIEKATCALRFNLKYEPNPGRSDASHVWRSLPDSLRGHRIIPITCGPGHRSHRDRDLKIMRKTHGMNEGFHKPTGLETLPFFLMLTLAFSLQDDLPKKRVKRA